MPAVLSFCTSDTIMALKEASVRGNEAAPNLTSSIPKLVLGFIAQSEATIEDLRQLSAILGISLTLKGLHT